MNGAITLSTKLVKDGSFMNSSIYKGRGSFSPNPRNIIDAAYNCATSRLPLYEHGISFQMMERITGKEYVPLWSEGWEGDDVALREFMSRYLDFYRLMNTDEAVRFHHGTDLHSAFPLL